MHGELCCNPYFSVFKSAHLHATLWRASGYWSHSHPTKATLNFTYKYLTKFTSILSVLPSFNECKLQPRIYVELNKTLQYDSPLFYTVLHLYSCIFLHCQSLNYNSNSNFLFQVLANKYIQSFLPPVATTIL
jgi:hypothetical protein